LMRFPGQWEDFVGGFSQNRFREYSSQGRYLSRDPKGLVYGLNVYSYTQGNPITYHDRLGLCFSESTAGGNCKLFNFGAFYFRKNGAKSDEIDMGLIGMLTELRTGQIGRLENEIFEHAGRKLRTGLTSQCVGKNCGRDGNVNFTLNLGKGFDRNYDVTEESECGVILGRGRLFAKGYCFGTMNCDLMDRDSGYNGFCYANFYINDRYEDACDFLNVFPTNNFDFGTPFRLTASWHSYRSFP